MKILVISYKDQKLDCKIDEVKFLFRNKIFLLNLQRDEIFNKKIAISKILFSKQKKYKIFLNSPNWQL